MSFQIHNLLRRASLLLTALAFYLGGIPALAQSPPDAGTLLREEQSLQRRPPERLPEKEASETIRPELAPVKGVTVTLVSVSFHGGEDLATPEELQALIQNTIGKKLNYTETKALADTVTKYLRDKGYLLARAYLPQQDVTNGAIEIVILKGRLDSNAEEAITIKGENLRINEPRLKKMVSTRIKPGDALNRTDLERTLLLINDLPGVSARSVIEPGTSPGTARLVLDTKEGPLISGRAWFDNYGSRYNGEGRGNGMLSINDPFGFGDQLTATVSGSENKTTGIFNYSMPLGWNGLRFSLSAATLQYEVGKEFGDADLEGSATTFSSQLTYPLLRSRRCNWNISTSYERKATKDKAVGINTKNRRINAFSIGLAGRRIDTFSSRSLSTWSAMAIAGKQDLSKNAIDLANDQATAKTNGSFKRYVYSMGHLQKLPHSFSAYCGITGQLASGNLGSSEKFSLGGPNGVKAYPVSEASGDEGWLASFELRYDMPTRFRYGNLQLQAFADTGNIRLYHNPYPGAVTNATGNNRYQLSSAGLGLNFYLNNRYNFRLAWAIPIGDNPGRSATNLDADGKDRGSRFWLQSMVMF